MQSKLPIPAVKSISDYSRTIALVKEIEPRVKRAAVFRDSAPAIAFSQLVLHSIAAAAPSGERLLLLGAFEPGPFDGLAPQDNLVFHQRAHRVWRARTDIGAKRLQPRNHVG